MRDHSIGGMDVITATGNQHVIGRASETHDAYANAPVHQIDQWLLKEAGELEGRRKPSFCPLQFRAASQEPTDYPCYGSGCF